MSADTSAKLSSVACCIVPSKLRRANNGQRTTDTTRSAESGQVGQCVEMCMLTCYFIGFYARMLILTWGEMKQVGVEYGRYGHGTVCNV